MSDAPIESLDELLRALSHERKLGGRLRVLGRAWSLLRGLSPAQREKVALRIGSKWAWKRVEKSFLADGELSENEQLVGRIFEKMGGSDPRELRGLARSIQAGDSSGAQDLLLMTLSDVLEETATDGEEALALQAEVALGAPESERAPELSGAQAESSPPHLVEALEVGLSEPTAERPAPAVDRAPDPMPELAPVLAAKVPLGAIPEASLPMKAPSDSGPAFSNWETAFEPIASVTPASSGVERLRVLRSLERSRDPGADLGRAGRAALLESLGGGWATRRALSRMIRERGVADLDEALSLIFTLARPGRQAWCLADLLQHWELGRDEVERVVGAAPTGAAHRRLRLRANTKRV